jgi:hypothetical protein
LRNVSFRNTKAALSRLNPIRGCSVPNRRAGVVNVDRAGEMPGKPLGQSRRAYGGGVEDRTIELAALRKLAIREGERYERDFEASQYFHPD